MTGKRILWSAALVAMAGVVLLAPDLLFPGAGGILCPLGPAAAQGDDCRAQEATITAQAAQIERLQRTANAQATELIRLQATQAAPAGALSTVAAQALRLTPGTTPQILLPPSDTPSPTATLGAQAAVAPVPGAIRVLAVNSPGRLASEAVIIENVGRSANIGGWTLASDGGARYTFPARMLLSDSTLTLFTRAGDETETALYWGRDTSAWRRGDTLTLADENGEPVAVFPIP